MSSHKPDIVIIGAGATGRGQIGQLAHSAGWRITFIEKRPDLVEWLKKGQGYRVLLAGPQLEEIHVDGFEVLHISDRQACAEAIALADIVATAVIPTNLRSTCPNLLDGFRLRLERRITKPLNVIACENMERSSTTLLRYLREESPDLDWPCLLESVGFPDAMVARAVPVPEPDPLVLIAEATQEWSVDAGGIKQPMPHLEGMTLSDNQEAALERKLYIKNTGHFSIGLLGFRKGYSLMDEAARDPEVLKKVDAATKESAAALIAKHQFDPSTTDVYRTSFLEAMKSPYLPDDIKRVIREPIRKLSREERLVGPAMLALDYGGEALNLAWMIAATLATLNADDPQSRELNERVQSQGVLRTFSEISGVAETHPLSDLVVEAYERVGGGPVVILG